MFGAITKLFANSTKRSTKSGFKPRLETLGDRFVPSVTSVTQNVTTGIATVTCDNGNDQINLTDPGTGGMKISGTGLNGTQTLDPRINLVIVNTNGGNDTVNYNLTSTEIRSMEIEVNLGAGNDIFSASQNGFNISNGAHEFLSVVGGTGNDQINVIALSTSANGGVDIDSGAKLELQLLGDNTLSAAPDMNDTLNVQYEGRMSGQLQLEESGGFGSDTLTAALTLDAGSTGLVTGIGAPATLDGGSGVDTYDFRVHNNSGGRAGVSAVIHSLDGTSETIHRTANVSVSRDSSDHDIVVS